MIHSFWAYFTDPLLYASTWGCLILGIGCGLVGTLLFLKKASLMGETLSHASYPGLMLGVLFLSAFPSSVSSMSNGFIDLLALVGAWMTSVLGVFIHSRLIKSKMSSDAALCWVLSSFLGVGVLVASKLQFSAARLYHRAQVFLYGQAATLSDHHLWLFGILVALMLLMVKIFYRPLLLHSFDRDYASCLGFRPLAFRVGIQMVITALIVSGLRAGGVLVMAALLVAPAVAARWWSRSFDQMLVLAALIGAVTGVLGNILSLETESFVQSLDLYFDHVLPTGPAIVIVGSLIAFISVLIAPEKGLLFRAFQARLLKKKWLTQLQTSENSGRELR